MATPLIQQVQMAQLVQEVKPEQWRFLKVNQITDKRAKRLAIRLNCLGSLFYFIKVGLGRHRLTTGFHYPMTQLVECTHVHKVIEMPRDHFKTTTFAEGASMWWALPFSNEDEYAMRQLGYGDEYIRWMRRTHNPDTRTLVVSEIIDNAIKIGARVDHHYKNGSDFRYLFPEIIPDSSCVWNAKSMTHKKTGNSPNGEGTYDFLGVGSALQSRHYDRIIEDDIFGRDAANSEKGAADAIDYHRKLMGAFDSSTDLSGELNDEIIVGNRWCFNDLNQWIRENEKELGYEFITHDAEGGCCDSHPVGIPIFPEEWTMEKLKKAQIKLGAYDYSCQYRNNPIPEGEAEFKPEWLRYYELAPVAPNDNRARIVHTVYNGTVIPDILPKSLQIELLTDPAHADRSSDGESKKRCRHAIVVYGLQLNPTRIYILEAWAKACTYHEYVAKIYEFAKQYKLPRIYMETVAAQKYLKFYLDYRNQMEGISLRVEELKIDTSAGAKTKRIRSMNSFYQELQVWVRQAHQDFILEYSQFPFSNTIDLIDVFGYAPQTFRPGMTTKQVTSWLERQKSQFENSRNARTGY